MKIGKDSDFSINTVQIIPVNDNNKYFAQTFNYAFTVVMFFALVSLLFAMLFRVIKDAGDD